MKSEANFGTHGNHYNAYLRECGGAKYSKKVKGSKEKEMLGLLSYKKKARGWRLLLMLREGAYGTPYLLRNKLGGVGPMNCPG